MNKVLKYSGLIGLGVFLIFGFITLIPRLSWNYQSKPATDEKITSDSTVNIIEIDVKELKLKINEVRVTKYSNITQMTTDEYVKGNKGLYYSIDLKDTVSQSILLFPAGEYSYEDNEWAVTKALDNVKSTVWTGILTNINYKIFIEGQADLSGDKTFSRKFLPKYKYDKIDYFPSHKSDFENKYYYDSTIQSKRLVELLINSDLPLLRASYLADKLSSYVDIPKPIILEGEVKDKIGADYRNGKIILFIDTSNQKK